MQTIVDELTGKAQAARRGARELAKANGEIKDQALSNIADGLKSREAAILEANAADCDAGRENGLSEALLDRLLLTPERLDGIAADVRNVMTLPDPVGEVSDQRTLPNGLQVGRRRVPLGVVGAIYESRPNVTVDISVLCLKSGNAIILRGGKEAVNSNTALARLVQDAVAEAGLPSDAVLFIESTDRALVGQMITAKGKIDLIVPRGGQALISRVAEEATVPAITGGVGVCHTYVDSAADPDMAVEIVFNAKVQRPSVCNALDTILVHSRIAPSYLPKAAIRLAEAGVEMRCDARALSVLGPMEGLRIAPATEDDWSTEHLSLTAGVRVVDSLDDALVHIETYGSGHSDAIVTEDYTAAMRFLDEVDSAAVFVNASTRFNDGAQLGLGTELAISTDKFHARGPMGLRELTSYKWTIVGRGQVRP
ncbi:MAG: glutamate-5-semialdehyde dehydrogenase [SAR202 cluster bacterium]|jgi:glutamate-5-semialdehyde dehydrogenase|nr:glutamate-5-semialdehyde dehydrogenase [SAR202 cluster bacterium]MDP6300753.1 glutamate-5-semialdehyde dehydrogenase [SAR202 cluster bacterium]MDP7104274.1 glutamate-5-semialdehyde dehydrogenase [SAR202 cluster bacterium]MDP7226307.1 glutamate-5-semialdehyde dehydrogenase [SAR202 cluster bacterium]MDP7412460.1 glutamate-5-semialdehyde dehydrogenase [SAR202 cluster bacterium]|tara:strand:- start:541 stop:1815 length:1275 start_codon:yes stop_codon:yes gene_type:complete